jgi:hypothetical protein
MEQLSFAIWSNKVRDALVARNFNKFSENLEEAVRLEGYYKDRARLRDIAQPKPQYIRAAVVTEDADDTSGSSSPEDRKPKKKRRARKKSKRLQDEAESTVTGHCVDKDFSHFVNEMTDAVRQIKEQASRLQLQPPMGQSVIPRAYPGQDMNTVQCFRCKLFGHFRRNCPNQYQPGVGQSWQQELPTTMGAARHARAQTEGIRSSSSDLGFSTDRRLQAAGEILYLQSHSHGQTNMARHLPGIDYCTTSIHCISTGRYLRPKRQQGLA